MGMAVFAITNTKQNILNLSKFGCGIKYLVQNSLGINI